MFLLVPAHPGSPGERAVKQFSTGSSRARCPARHQSGEFLTGTHPSFIPEGMDTAPFTVLLLSNGSDLSLVSVNIA